jgi:hypothetical protein
MGIAKELYMDEPAVLNLEQTAYALDDTTIGLCLSMSTGATFLQTKGAVKLQPPDRDAY